MRALIPLLLALALPLSAQEAPEPGPDLAGSSEGGGAAWAADPAAPLDAAEVELGDFLYLARPFVIFADSPRQPELAEQLRLLADDPGELARRDVAVIVDSDPAGGSALRRELRPRGFGVVLVDKDGRVTLRRPAPLSVREIARTIDRTPIRQDEIRAGE